ncbi:MAG: hypothetical protein RR384_08380, partial [Acidaminococcaceae bacterium]
MTDNYIVQILSFLYEHWLLTMIFLLFLPNNHVNIDLTNRNDKQKNKVNYQRIGRDGFYRPGKAPNPLAPPA